MENLAIIDGDYIAYIAINRNKVLDSFGNPEKDEKGNFIYDDSKTLDDVKEGIDSFIESLLNKCSADFYIGFLTYGSFRKNINLDYKTNRKKEPVKFLYDAKNYLRKKWQFKSYEDHSFNTLSNTLYFNDIFLLESDDLCNLYRIYYNNNFHCFICSNDKDLLNLEGTHFNIKTFNWYTTDEKQANYEFIKDLIIGQPGDNIKGIPNKGEKFFEGWWESHKFLNNLNGKKSIRLLLAEVFDTYLSFDLSIEYFYKQYTSLKILDDIKVITKYHFPNKVNKN